MRSLEYEPIGQPIPAPSTAAMVPKRGADPRADHRIVLETETRPKVWSAAGRDPVVGPGPGIATVTKVGFCGFLVGPTVIGLMSKFFGLSVALGVVVEQTTDSTEYTDYQKLRHLTCPSFVTGTYSYMSETASRFEVSQKRCIA